MTARSGSWRGIMVSGVGAAGRRRGAAGAACDCGGGADPERTARHGSAQCRVEGVKAGQPSGIAIGRVRAWLRQQDTDHREGTAEIHQRARHRGDGRRRQQLGEEPGDFAAIVALCRRRGDDEAALVLRQAGMRRAGDRDGPGRRQNETRHGGVQSHRGFRRTDPGEG